MKTILFSFYPSKYNAFLFEVNANDKVINELKELMKIDNYTPMMVYAYFKNKSFICNIKAIDHVVYDHQLITNDSNLNY